MKTRIKRIIANPDVNVEKVNGFNTDTCVSLFHFSLHNSNEYYYLKF